MSVFIVLLSCLVIVGQIPLIVLVLHFFLSISNISKISREIRIELPPNSDYYTLYSLLPPQMPTTFLSFASAKIEQSFHSLQIFSQNISRYLNSYSLLYPPTAYQINHLTLYHRPEKFSTDNNLYPHLIPSTSPLCRPTSHRTAPPTRPRARASRCNLDNR